MKYCLDYYKICRYTNKCDQLNFTYNKRDEALLSFLQEHANQRINLVIKDEDIDNFIETQEYKVLEAIYQQAPNFVLRFYENQKASVIHEKLANLLPDLTIPYYFGHIITNWDEFYYFINLGICDIILGEEICFELDKAAAIAHAKNILIHIFPNVAQSPISQTPALYKFFVRPEDTKLYEQYVDVFEFWGDAKKLSAYYKIYALSGRWLGNLNYIIISLHHDIPNDLILPQFAQSRISCGKECLKGGKCRICNQIDSIAHNLQRAREKAEQINENN